MGAEGTASPALAAKRSALRDRLRSLGRCAVAFSGGVDSTYLLAEAMGVLGERALAVTVRGPLHTEGEEREAEALAEGLGARHLFVEGDPLGVAGFDDNPPERCYICKRHLFGTLLERSAAEGWGAVVEGSNADDAGAYRPGRRALKELGVASPLEEAGLTKADIRRLSRELGLPTWDKPALACLATRFPYGTRLTAEGLARVARAEARLGALGLRVVRLRVHGETARIEVGEDEMAALAGPLRRDAARAVKAEGFAYAAMDLEGYRMGAMDETLDETARDRGGKPT